MERLVGAGGMPSSHSATVCALTASAGIRYGVESFNFAICCGLASVVMYDAMGVRQETGKQAKLLNLIMEQDFFPLDILEFVATWIWYFAPFTFEYFTVTFPAD